MRPLVSQPRHLRAQEEKTRLPLNQARGNALKLDWSGAYVPPKPSFIGTKTFVDYQIAELVDFIDWSPFFQTWELNGKFPAILDDAKFGPAARSLYDDARAMLDRIVAERWFKASAVAGFWPANSMGEDIEVYADDHFDAVGAGFGLGYVGHVEAEGSAEGSQGLEGDAEVGGFARLFLRLPGSLHFRWGRRGLL